MLAVYLSFHLYFRSLFVPFIWSLWKSWNLFVNYHLNKSLVNLLSYYFGAAKPPGDKWCQKWDAAMPIQKYLFRDPAISIQRYLSSDPASFWKIYLHRDTYPVIRLQGYQIKDFKTYIRSQFNWLRILQEQLLISTIFEVILQEKIQELNTVRLRRPNIYSITTLLNDVLIKTQERDTTIPQTSFTVSKNKTFCEL